VSESKKAVLCADDFGLDSSVSRGILKLVHMERLSAVSCMTNMPDFVLHSEELYSLKKQVKMGFHFNLTEGYFLSTPSKRCFTLNELLIKSHLQSLKLSFIATEFLAQLDQFVALMRQLPDFIDGHQHVHQFPAIRRVILDLYQQRLQKSNTAIRSTWPSINVPNYQCKAKVLALTGGKALNRQLIKLGIPHNQYFSGIYSFAADTNYRDLFRSWLHLLKEDTLIMCHPGEGLGQQDNIAAARLLELNYFASDHFLNDCDEYSIRLA
jgi:predicted glycoside hydrolase/deacetylase ChbG (UPF0249 family)